MTNSRALGFIMAGLAILAACGVAIVEPLFFSTGNLLNVLRQSTPLIIIAMAQTLPLLARGLDLSQGGIVVATSVVYAILASQIGPVPAIVPALLIGMLAGCVSGSLIAWLDLSPLVVTLGLGSVMQGLALVIANGQPITNVPPNFSDLYYGSVVGIPIPILLTVLLIGGYWLLLERSILGRRIRAVGSSPRAAFLSGIPVRKTLLATYTLAGIGASIGAILLASRISSGHPTAGSDMALQAVAAAVIGGVSLLGGRGSIFGAVVGAVFLSLLSNALNILNISSFIQLVAIGLVIIVAVVIDRARHAAIQVSGG